MKDQRGQAIVETALVVPILLIFICMIIDTGRIVYFESRLNSVCQEAVRIAGLGGTDADVQNYTLNQIGSTALVDTKEYSDSSTTIQVASTRNSGDFVTVTLTDDLNYITPLANVILPSPFKATAQSTIRVE